MDIFSSFMKISCNGVLCLRYLNSDDNKIITVAAATSLIMKAIAPFAVLGLLLGSTSSVFAQAGSISGFMSALTLTHSRPGTVLKDPETGKVLPKFDSEGEPLGGPAYSNEWTVTRMRGEDIASEESHVEYISKMATLRYSNREILLDLLDLGVIEAQSSTGSPIAGWSLIVVSDENDDENLVYARHTNKTTVNVSEHVMWPSSTDESSEEEGGYYGASDSNYKYVMKTVYRTEDEITTETESRIYKYKSKVSFNWMEKLFGNGVVSGGGKLTFLTQRTDGETEKFPVYVPAAGKVAAISGGFVLDDVFDPVEGEPIQGVVEGTISMGAGKAYLDLDAFLNPIQ